LHKERADGHLSKGNYCCSLDVLCIGKQSYMKTLFLIRHAKSSWKDPSLDDIDRPLNKRGKRDAPFMAKLVSGKGLRPDRLISSPAKRALTTAEYFAKALELTRKQIDIRDEIYEAAPEDIHELIRALPEEENTILLFGHNPTFTAIANYFSEEYIANVPTCGVVQLQADTDSWNRFDKEEGRLIAFYYPKQYFN